MLTPLDPKQWDLTKAAHLLNRAGFGGSPEQIEALHAMGFDKAVASMLNAPDDSQQFAKPADIAPVNYLAMIAGLADADKKTKVQEIQKQQRGNMLELMNWWLNRMAQTPNPLREKMTLFWHGNFATSVQKVKQAYLMWQQNETFRQNALGNFGDLAKAVSRDPAMMIYLDTRESKKEHPNENFARELMELFMLGIGNYTEDDIQNSARAFTGYRIDPRDQSFRYAPFQHDDGVKTFFGQSGKYGGDDIINLILQKPACAQYITKKLWKFFAYENPSPELVTQLGGSLRGYQYEIKPMLGEIFRSAEFYSAKAIRMQIKSPVQWLVQTSKILQTDMPPTIVSVNALRQMGQIPFAPPNVKGWDGGKAWITTSTLLFRYNLSNFELSNGGLGVQAINKLAAANKAAGRPEKEVTNRKPVDLAVIAPPDVRSNPDKLIASLCFRLYQSQLTPKETQPFRDFLKDKAGDTSDQTVRELLHLMMSTPEYQLT
ncbi:MAG TPA: DUF1800 domain-containing protein [Chthoniobacteraceae bacterium]|nr:DUF1800 domain-containing protein [Chthoniobacteraceae bacterium]